MMKKEAARIKTNTKEPYDYLEKVLKIKIDREHTSLRAVQNLVQRMDAVRTDVGSRNPYALVEYILGVKIDWEHSSPDAVERLLRKMIDEPFYTAFNDLHAPVHDTQLPKGQKKIAGRVKS
jgi:hypothetical protein